MFSYLSKKDIILLQKTWNKAVYESYGLLYDSFMVVLHPF